MRWRVVVVPLLTVLVSAAAVEWLARDMRLDDRQRQAMRVEYDLLIANNDGASGAALGIDYLPRRFSMDEGGFTTAWGRCDYDHPGPTVMAFGDSVTRQVGLFGHAQEHSPDARLRADESERTWPALLRARLPEDWQVCVFAEDGYHPAEYAAVLSVVGPHLKPDYLVVQLCENDLIDPAPRIAEPMADGGVALYEPVRDRLAYAPLYHRGLYEASEAARFAHWRLQARFGRSLVLPVDVPVGTSLDAVLSALYAGAPKSFFFYVPRLDDPVPERPRGWKRVEDSGVAVMTVALPEPLTALRSQHDDPVHLNIPGQEALAAWVWEEWEGAPAASSGASPEEEAPEEEAPGPPSPAQ